MCSKSISGHISLGIAGTGTSFGARRSLLTSRSMLKMILGPLLLLPNFGRLLRLPIMHDATHVQSTTFIVFDILEVHRPAAGPVATRASKSKGHCKINATDSA